MSHIGILGGGAFGSALAHVLAQKATTVTVWNRTPRPTDYPLNVVSTSKITDALAPDVILISIPMQQCRAVLEPVAARLAFKTVVACCKGIELSTGRTACDMIETIAPDAEIAMLSGPGFAADIKALQPTAMSIAASTIAHAERVQAILSTPSLRLYATDDRKGVEIGGAVKNVIALAAGITIGAGYGDSARAALVARGFREMQDFAKGQGARPETLTGLSGLGDLFLTCSSSLSRNFRQGVSIGEAGGRYEETGVTVEGVATAHALAKWSRDAGTDLPITCAVADVLSGTISLTDALRLLFERPLRAE